MFGNDRILQLFADQFEPNGVDYLYRKNNKGTAFRVSPEERQKYIQDFAKNYRWFFWIILASIIAAIFLSVLFDATKNAKGYSLATYAVGGVALVAFLVGFKYVWAGPYRSLRNRRRPEGGERTRAEAREIGLAKVSWLQFAFSGIFATGILIHFWTKYDLTQGWNRLWLLLAAAYFVVLGVQIVRKLRLQDGKISDEKALELDALNAERGSWWRVARGAFTGITVTNIVGGWAGDFLGNLRNMIGGEPHFSKLSEVPLVDWLLMYVGWIVCLCAGQAIGAIIARWPRTVWIVAIFNSLLFGLLYWLLKETPQFLPAIFLPFVTAFFVERNQLVLSRIVAGRNISAIASTR